MVIVGLFMALVGAGIVAVGMLVGFAVVRMARDGRLKKPPQPSASSVRSRWGAEWAGIALGGLCAGALMWVVLHPA